MKRLVCQGIGIAALLFAFSMSFLHGKTFAAEKEFPKKTITIIINLGAGGARDIVGRAVAKTMSKYLGVPVVVENVPGAGGKRGIIQLYHSAPDGYTIGGSAASQIIDQILEKEEYDMRKFIHIGRIQSSPLLFWVRSNSPFKSLKDFKTYGKVVRHSTHSLTATSTVAPMIIANREGWTLVIIGGFASAAESLMSLIRGEVEFMGTQTSQAAPFVRSGQIRPIATIARSRSPEFPNTPTVGEMGHEDLGIFSYDFWFMAPPGVPKERIEILEDALMKTLKDPEFLAWAKGASIDISPLRSAENTKMVFDYFKILERYKQDIEKYIKK